MRTYGDRRPYVAPDTLDQLAGPTTGSIELPAQLGWTGRTVYQIDDLDDAAVLYERILVDSVSVQHIVDVVNATLLTTLWSRLFLPARVRLLWEARFPRLSTAA